MRNIISIIRPSICLFVLIKTNKTTTTTVTMSRLNKLLHLNTHTVCFLLFTMKTFESTVDWMNVLDAKEIEDRKTYLKLERNISRQRKKYFQIKKTTTTMMMMI